MAKDFGKLTASLIEDLTGKRRVKRSESASAFEKRQYIKKGTRYSKKSEVFSRRSVEQDALFKQSGEKVSLERKAAKRTGFTSKRGVQDSNKNMLDEYIQHHPDLRNDPSLLTKKGTINKRKVQQSDEYHKLTTKYARLKARQRKVGHNNKKLNAQVLRAYLDITEDPFLEERYRANYM